MTEPQDVAAQLREAFATGELALLEPLLDPRVRWGGEEETEQTCHSRADVLAWYARTRDAGVRAEVIRTIVRDHTVVLGLALSGPEQGPDGDRPEHVFQTFRLADGLIVDIRGYPTLAQALATAATPVPTT